MKLLQKILFVMMICTLGGNSMFIFAMKSTSSSSSSISDSSSSSEHSSTQQDLLQAITGRDIQIICMQRTFNPLQPIIKIQNHVDQVFQEINGQINDSKWTFVIFSEHFWGGATQALTSDEIQHIINRCNAILNTHPQLIIHINFLHKFNFSTLSEGNCNWLFASRGFISEYDGNRIFGEVKPSDNCFTKQSNMHISNYSLIIHQGMPIAIYRKGTYANESDSDIISGGYIYEFGDFQTHAIGENPLSEIFTGDHQQIITRICADMNSAFLDNIPSAELAIVPANMMNVREAIKNIPVKDAIFVDTNPNRQISHLQKANYMGESTIYRPQRTNHKILSEADGFDMYQYNLSAVTGFDQVAAVPQHLAPREEVVDYVDDSDDGCCRRCCLGCFGCCCCKK